MSRQYFGTDGVRGPYGGPLINEDFAARLAFAAATWLRGAGERRIARAAGGATLAVERRERAGVGRVLIGRDTRFSGAALEAAVARGLRAAGAEPLSLGVLPTPAVARAVRESGARLGVVITASHNPAADNGIKFFGSGGMKLTDDDERAIEALLPAAFAATDEPLDVVGAVTDYVAATQAILPAQALRGWKIVVDTANGATSATTPVVLRELGADVIGIGDAPDGRNINAGVGSEHPELMTLRVRAEGARLGIAHDGDGDRCVLCDERGEVLDGDEILTVLAMHALAQRRLAQNTLAVTVQSNLGVDAAIAAAGGRVVRTNVGDRYVIERMRADGLTLGGESSGHIICWENSPTGDGLVAALRVLEVMLATQQPLSVLRQTLRKFPQRTAALKVKSKPPLETLPQLSAAIRAIESELGAQGRVLVRYSGTEAKLRLLVEGPTLPVVEAALARLTAAVAAEGL